jgi:hypothetical protein
VGEDLGLIRGGGRAGGLGCVTAESEVCFGVAENGGGVREVEGGLSGDFAQGFLCASTLDGGD